MTNEQSHRKLWKWLAKHPKKQKEAYFNKFVFRFKKIPRAECYGCQEKIEFGKCPFSHIDNNGCDIFECLGGLFAEWDREKDLKKRSELAKQISELEWR